MCRARIILLYVVMRKAYSVYTVILLVTMLCLHVAVCACI